MEQDYIETYVAEHYGDILRPGEWRIQSHGVWREKKDGAKEWACQIPILPTSLLYNIEEHIEKVKLEFKKRKKWESIIVPRSTISNKNNIIKLSDVGVEVTSDNASSLMRYLNSCISESLDIIPQEDACSTLGWSDNGFLPYNSDIVFDGDRSFKQLYDSISEKGSHEKWVDHMKTLRKNTDLRLCMATSFASPLLELIGENPFIVEIWGGTGAGKTVTLMVAMSIWGNPEQGHLVRTMNMTQNSMLSTASFLKNLPFAGDELQTIKTNWGNYDQLIMRVTEGIDRARLNSSGQLLDIKSWKCAFLFSGEDSCTKAESGGGAKNRVIEIECKNKLIPNGNETANLVRQNYGTAGRIFIEKVQSIRDTLTSEYRKLFNEILDKCDTTDKQAGSMSVLLLADRIASELFWQGERPLSINDIKDYLASAKEVDVSERAFDFALATISENEKRFDPEQLQQRWGKFENDPNDPNVRICYFNMSVLNRVMNDAGFTFNSVKNSWKTKKYIRLYNDGNIRYPKKIGSVLTSCIAIIMPNNELQTTEKSETTDKKQSYNAPETSVETTEKPQFKEIDPEDELPF